MKKSKKISTKEIRNFVLLFQVYWELDCGKKIHKHVDDVGRKQKIKKTRRS